MFTGLIARLGLKLLFGRMWANAKGDWAAMPRKVKLALLTAALLAASVFFHQHYAHKALKSAEQAGYDRARAEDTKVLAELRRRAATAEVNGKTISQDTRSTNDEANRTIAADAGDLRVRGPGAARCGRVDHPTLSAAGGQPRSAGGQSADAAAGPLPAADGQPDVAAVPWPWLVGRAEQADLDRAEVLSWRDWYQRQSAEWAKLRPAADAGH